MVKWREGERPKPVVLPERMVLDAGVCAMTALQQLHGALAVGGVGEEDLVAHALGKVEQ
jgi:hypothetical protein